MTTKQKPYIVEEGYKYEAQDTPVEDQGTLQGQKNIPGQISRKKPEAVNRNDPKERKGGSSTTEPF